MITRVVILTILASLGSALHPVYSSKFIPASTPASTGSSLKCDFGSGRSETAPGAPGISHSWAPASKDAIGTAREPVGSHRSPVWFTLSEGILSEVFYPHVDQAQVGDVQFLVTDGAWFFSEQRRNTIHKVEYLDEGMVVKVSGRDKSGAYQYEQFYFTDPDRPVLRIRTQMKWLRPGLRLFVLKKPAIRNFAEDDVGAISHGKLLASHYRTTLSENNTASALGFNVPVKKASVGYVGCSDGWQDLSKNFELSQTWTQAGPGNVALTAELEVPSSGEFTFEMALGFGPTMAEAFKTVDESFLVPSLAVQSSYENGWKGFLESLQKSRLGNQPFIHNHWFARRSAQLIKMHEDKIYRGAMVASLSKPGIPNRDRAGSENKGGYHLVWPRDLYHSAMALLSAGDIETPVQTLRYLTLTQQQNGSWYQNFWLDGVPYWEGLQMDEVAFPILLAQKIQKLGVLDLGPAEINMIRKAAQFIQRVGPSTQQERWEEVGGFVPSTLAATIAALEAASNLLKDPSFRQTAEHWKSNLENWTAVQRSPLGENYYLRVSPTGNPQSPERFTIANGGPNVFAWEILDGGFLELVKLGVRSPDHPTILSTLRLYESPKLGIAGPTWNGAMAYRRYNRDQYGHFNVGGYWPILAAERGIYAIASGDFDRAARQLQYVESVATVAGILTEQTHDLHVPPTVGPGVAGPLAWSHANAILLYRSVQDGRVFESP